MIRQRVKAYTKPLEDLIEFSGDFVRISGDIGERAFKRVEPDLRDELQYYPAPPPNSTYDRTYRLRNGWDLDFQRTSGGFEIDIENDTPYAKHVVGSLAQAITVAASYQAMIHKGRWPLAIETVLFWYDAFFEVYQDEFVRELAPFGDTTFTKRAFTR